MIKVQLIQFMKSLMNQLINFKSKFLISKLKSSFKIYNQKRIVMTEYSHNSVILKKNNEARFNQLWGLFAKSQPNAMRLSQFMQFVVDRCLVNNKITIKHFYELFEQATRKRLEQQSTNENKPGQQASLVLEKTIKKQEFIFLLNQLGKHVYHNASNYQDRVYNDLLGQHITAQKDQMQYSRVMIMDEINRKMLMENSIKTVSEYEHELKNLYMIYVEENYFSLKKQKRLLLSHREIQLQNKKMSALGFVRFLKEADIVPHLINVEHVEEILSRVVPSCNVKQNEFYYKHFLVDSYSKDLDNPELKHQGDPGLLLFEFQFALARIAIETSKEMDNAKKMYDYLLNKFFGSYLSLRKNQQLNDKIHNKLPDFNKVYLHNLKKYYELADDETEHQDVDSEGQDEYNPFEQMVDNQRKLEKLPPLEFNIPSMIKALNQELPPLPEEIVVKQQCPPPFPAKFKDVERITIGQQPPPEKADKKGAQKVAPKKANQLKKGEKPPRVFQFKKVQEQTKKVASSQDYFQKLATQLDYSLKPLSSLQRGNIPLDPFPSLITQILYPPQIPQQVLPYIEAALNAHNEGRFALSLQNYKKAYDLWKEVTNVNDLPPSLELYFEFTKGSVYLSAGKDDYGFSCFFGARALLEKIPYLNPDRALPYCGIGEALYNAQEYELAARAFLKAREIREALLGIQSVDTATVFNNLGCCFFMLDRSKQALSYFKVSSAVMVSELGQFHQRSQTTRQNTNLCNKAFFTNVPQFRKLWEVFQKDPFGKKKKKKKKDGKKK